MEDNKGKTGRLLFTTTFGETPVPFSFNIEHLRLQLGSHPGIRNIAWSSRNLIAFVTPGAPNPFSKPRGSDLYRIFILDPNSPAKLVCHLPSMHRVMISFLRWHVSGTMLLSADDSGHIIVWRMENSASEWTVYREIHLHESVAAIQWLPSERAVRATTGLTAADLISGMNQLPVAVESEEVGMMSAFGNIAFMVVTTSAKISIVLESALDGLVQLGRHVGGVTSAVHVAHAHISFQAGARAIVAIHLQGNLVHYSVVLYDVCLSNMYASGPSARHQPPKDTPTLEIIPHSRLDVSIEHNEQLTHIAIVRRPKEDMRLLSITCQPQQQGFRHRVGLWELTWTSLKVHPRFNFTGVTPDRGTWVLNSLATLDYVTYVSSVSLQEDSLVVAILFADGRIVFKDTSNGHVVCDLSAPDEQDTDVDSRHPLIQSSLPAVALALSPNHAAVMQLYASGEMALSLIEPVALVPFTMTPNQLDRETLAMCVAYAFVVAIERRVDYWDLLQLIPFWNQQYGGDDFFDEVSRIVFSYYDAPNHDVDTRQLWALEMCLYRMAPTRQIAASNSYAALQIGFIRNVFLLNLCDAMGCINKINDFLAGSQSLEILALPGMFERGLIWSLVPMACWIIDFVISALYNVNYALMGFQEELSQSPDESSFVVPASIPLVSLLFCEPLRQTLTESIVLCHILHQQIVNVMALQRASPEAQYYAAFEALMSRPNFNAASLLAMVRHLPIKKRGNRNARCLGDLPSPLVLTKAEMLKIHVALHDVYMSHLSEKGGALASDPPFSKEGVEGKLHLLRSLSNHLELPVELQGLLEGQSVATMDLPIRFILYQGPHDQGVYHRIRNDVVRHYKLTEGPATLHCMRCYRKSSSEIERELSQHNTQWYAISRYTCVCGGTWRENDPKRRMFS